MRGVGRVVPAPASGDRLACVHWLGGARVAAQGLRAREEVGRAGGAARAGLDAPLEGFAERDHELR